MALDAWRPSSSRRRHWAASLTPHSSGKPSPTRTDARNCFTVNDWHGWSSPSPDVLYLAVNFKDVYKAELTQPAPGLDPADTVIISDETGLQSICSAVDLHLIMTRRGGGGRRGLIVKSLTRLTPEEIAAIPKKYRPN